MINMMMTLSKKKKSQILSIRKMRILSSMTTRKKISIMIKKYNEDKTEEIFELKRSKLQSSQKIFCFVYLFNSF